MPSPLAVPGIASPWTIRQRDGESGTLASRVISTPLSAARAGVAGADEVQLDASDFHWMLSSIELI
jgi:hypothetical protein